jgi:hypothetical protein
MTKKAFLLALNAAFFAIFFGASPPLEDQKTIASRDIARSIDQPAPAPGRGEAAKKAKASPDSAKVRPLGGVLSKRIISIPESWYRES